MPVVPSQPKKSPDRSGNGGPFENQYGPTEHEPILQISPVGNTTSRPLTMSELKPYWFVRRPCPCITTFAAIVVIGGASGTLCLRLGWCSFQYSLSAPWETPPSTTTYLAPSFPSSILSILFMSITIPPLRGITRPVNASTAPLGTIGTFSLFASFTISCTSSVVLGITT